MPQLRGLKSNLGKVWERKFLFFVVVVQTFFLFQLCDRLEEEVAVVSMDIDFVCKQCYYSNLICTHTHTLDFSTKVDFDGERFRYFMFLVGIQCVINAVFAKGGEKRNT